MNLTKSMDNPFEQSGNRVLSAAGALCSVLFNGLAAIMWSDIEIGVRVVLGIMGIFSAGVAGYYHITATRVKKLEKRKLEEEIKALKAR